MAFLYGCTGRLTINNCGSRPGQSADFLSLHFLRPGRWAVPLPTAAESDGSVAAGGGWEVRLVDYWSMTVKVIGSVEAGAKNCTIDVPEIPGNYEIARAGMRW
jgi:hypothetical protein